MLPCRETECRAGLQHEASVDPRLLHPLRAGAAPLGSSCGCELAMVASDQGHSKSLWADCPYWRSCKQPILQQAYQGLDTGVCCYLSSSLAWKLRWKLRNAPVPKVLEAGEWLSAVRKHLPGLIEHISIEGLTVNLRQRSPQLSKAWQIHCFMRYPATFSLQCCRHECIPL